MMKNFRVNNSLLKSILFGLILLLGSPCFVYSQTEHQEENQHKESPHSISFLMSHTHISQGSEGGVSRWLVLPSFGFDYNYKFSSDWSLGIHNDLILESFKIIKPDGETELERTRPIVSILTAGYKPGKHLTYQIGVGGEFAKEEHFFLTRIGIEYGYEISENLEVFTNLVYDVKWAYYDSYVIGIGVTKRL
jgi:hypothetical protein